MLTRQHNPIRKNFYIIASLFSLWIMFSVCSYYLLARTRSHLSDFYPRWEGSRAVLARENPYSSEVSWRIQETMFGRRQEPYEIVQHYVYPATLTILLLPFWVLPYPLAISLWHGLLLLFLLLSPLGVILLLNWKIRSISFAYLLIFSLLAYRHPINTYVLGQFIPFILACLILAWWGIAANNSVITILGLLGLLVRPEVVVVPLLVLLIHNCVEGRRRVVLTWAVISVLMWLVTRILIGPWEIEFLKGIISYTGYSFVQWPPLAVGSVWAGMLLALFVLGWGIWMLREMRGLPSQKRLPWEISISVLVTLIVLPQTNNYTLVIGLVAIWVGLWASEGSLIEWVLYSVILISPWMFHTIGKALPPAIEQLLIPLAIGVLLTRRWFLWIGEERQAKIILR